MTGITYSTVTGAAQTDVLLGTQWVLGENGVHLHLRHGRQRVGALCRFDTDAANTVLRSATGDYLAVLRNLASASMTSSDFQTLGM